MKNNEFTLERFIKRFAKEFNTVVEELSKPMKEDKEYNITLKNEFDIVINELQKKYGFKNYYLRNHRGGLKESLETYKKYNIEDGLGAHIYIVHEIAFSEFKKITIKYYAEDERIKYAPTQFIICADNCACGWLYFKRGNK